MSKKESKKSEKKSLTLNEIFNNPKTIIIALIILCVGLLIALYSSTKSNAFYYSTYSDNDLAIPTIHFFKSNKVNYFYSTSASYSGEDKEVYNYLIGYFYYDTATKQYIEIAAMQGTNTTATSLSKLINFYSAYNLAEYTKDGKSGLNKMGSNVSSIHFLVKASTTADSTDYDIDMDFEIPVSKAV